MYGNKASSYTAPYAVQATSYGTASGSLESSHWFGRCSEGGCPFCTNNGLLEAGQDWAGFAAGNTCTDGASDGDTDFVRRMRYWECYREGMCVACGRAPHANPPCSPP